LTKKIYALSRRQKDQFNPCEISGNISFCRLRADFDPPLRTEVEQFGLTLAKRTPFERVCSSRAAMNIGDVAGSMTGGGIESLLLCGRLFLQLASSWQGGKASAQKQHGSWLRGGAYAAGSAVSDRKSDSIRGC
jgi:hypothetical protein